MSKPRAICAAALSALLLAVTLLAQWHQATVLHARCAEHGELVHVHAKAKTADHTIAAHDGAPEAEHEHCTMCPAAHDGAPAVRTILRVVMPPAVPAPLATPRAIALVDEAPYRDAPKTSPPANASLS
ncbi:MAG TPA: hypothetical protein VL463_22590 [Kofleriaceae bacterium]|jgi:hypothetical protein|nr:hypothetical protein [Kofleriaceae bacterium]